MYDKVLRQVCASFGMETSQEEPQKAIDIGFWKVTMSPFSLPTGYEKSLIYQAAPVIDHLSSLEETGHYIYCAAR